MQYRVHRLLAAAPNLSAPGLCLLVTCVAEDSPAFERLNAVASTLDGFELARIDLEQRREGDVLGIAQSGTRSHLKLLRVLRDEVIINQARTSAERTLEAGISSALQIELDKLIKEQEVEYLDKG